MRSFDIRLETDPNPASLALGKYAFEASPRPRDEKEIADYLKDRNDVRVLFSYVDNEPLAKVGVVPMTLNVRGVVMPMGGIGGVATMPIARRGGHIRALMDAAIIDMHEQGQAVSALYPFKQSFYEMFGYTVWNHPLYAIFDPAGIAGILKVPKTGSMKQRLSTDILDELWDLLGSFQSRLHGFCRPNRIRFDANHKHHLTWVLTVHEGDDVTGLLTYRIDEHPTKLVADTFLWTTTNGLYQLLDFAARHGDQAEQIILALPPDVKPDQWWINDKGFTQTSDSPLSWGPGMGRVVDITGLNGIGAGDGEITLDVTDPQGPWNTGVWTFRGRDGALEVQQGGTPSGSVTIAGLSALVFTGTDARTLSYHGWGQIDDEVATIANAIFPSTDPYLHEQF